MTIASIDPYLGRRRRGENYSCKHFAREVWLDHTGDDIADRLGSLFDGQRVRKSELASFEELDGPVDPCLVMFRRQHAGAPPHLGVFIRGRVLHLADKAVRYERLDLARAGFASARFYR